METFSHSGIFLHTNDSAIFCILHDFISAKSAHRCNTVCGFENSIIHHTDIMACIYTFHLHEIAASAVYCSSLIGALDLGSVPIRHADSWNEGAAEARCGARVCYYVNKRKTKK